MTTENKDKINKELTQIRNVTILLKSMFRTIPEYMREFNCNENEAIQKKEKAYDFLKKYSVDYLETAEKHIREITDEEYKNVNNLILIGNKL